MAATQLPLPYDVPPGTLRFWVYVYADDDEPAWARVVDTRAITRLEDAEALQELVGYKVGGWTVALVEVAAQVTGQAMHQLVRSYK